jgi:hypothetical protein
MAKLPAGKFDPSEFLVERKFGAGARHADTTFPVSLSGNRHARTDPEFAKRVAQYRAELLELPSQELKALVEAEREKEQAELAARIEREEREQYFNQPCARADFEHWSRAAHWTLDEAVALSFGKAPERVNWETVKPFVRVSAFAIQYQRRRDLALRATLWKQLFDPVLPGFFLAWAKRTDLEVSSDLEAAVTARGVLVADWKTHYDDLKTKYDELHRKWGDNYDELQKGWMEVCEDKNRTIAELQQQLAGAEAKTASAQPAIPRDPPEKPLGTRERESLLKLIIGMAVGGYGYDPSAGRSEQPAQIATDLETAGVALDVDTVRKWLKQAAELLPPWKTE